MSAYIAIGATPCAKKAYCDKKAAISQINRVHKVRGRHGRAEYLRAYYCPDCGSWHLTKQPLT